MTKITTSTLIHVGWVSSSQAFVGFEAGQRCFPDPVVSNDEGTKRVKYVPSGREKLGECTNEHGGKIDGLTIEGELNKVRTYSVQRHFKRRTALNKKHGTLQEEELNA